MSGPVARDGDGASDDGDPSGPVCFVAWGAIAGRTQELADAVGGRARCFFPPGRRRPPAGVRWALSAVATAVHLLRCRPSWVVVTNPPLPAALVSWVVGRALGARIVLDSHPGGFGAQGDRVAARLQGLHRWLVRRADLTLVAADVWKERVERWGGRGLVVHEAPGRWCFSSIDRHPRLRVLYVGRFAGDEPWAAVLEAAAASPWCDVVMTGDARRAGVDPRAVPGNVTLAGFLDAARYQRAVEDADIVLTLTTEPGSVMRAACEAVWAGRPLVLSDWPVARDLFPFAVHVANDAAGVADGLLRAERSFDRLATAAADAHRLQRDRWESQRRDLLAHLGRSVEPPRARR